MNRAYALGIYMFVCNLSVCLAGWLSGSLALLCVCVCVCVFVCVCDYVYICACVYVYVYIYIFICKGVVHETHRAWARLVKGNAEEDALKV